MFKLEKYQMNENCEQGDHSDKNADGVTWIIFKLHEDTLINKITVCRIKNKEECKVLLNEALKKVDGEDVIPPSEKYKPFKRVDKNISLLTAGVYCFNSKTFRLMFKKRRNQPSFKLLIEGSNYEYHLEKIKCGKTNNKSTTTRTKKSQVNANTAQPSSNNNHSNQQLEVLSYKKVVIPTLEGLKDVTNCFLQKHHYELSIFDYFKKTRKEWGIESTKTVYFNNDYFNRIVNNNTKINGDIENYYRDEKSNEYSIPIIIKPSFCEISIGPKKTKLENNLDSILLDSSDLIKVIITLDEETIYYQNVEELRFAPQFVRIQITHELYFPPDTNIYLLLQFLQKFIKSFNINDYYVYKKIGNYNVIPVYKTSTKLKQLINSNQTYNFNLQNNTNTLSLILLPFYIFCFWRPKEKYDKEFYFGTYTNLYFKITPKYNGEYNPLGIKMQNTKNSVDVYPQLQNNNLQQYNAIPELCEIFKNNTPTITNFYSSIEGVITYKLFTFNLLLYTSPLDTIDLPNEYVDNKEFCQMTKKLKNINVLDCSSWVNEQSRETYFDDNIGELCQAMKNLELKNMEINYKESMEIAIEPAVSDNPSGLIANYSLNLQSFTFYTRTLQLGKRDGYKSSIIELLFRFIKYVLKHFGQYQKLYFQKYEYCDGWCTNRSFKIPICDESLSFIFNIWNTKLIIPRDDEFLSDNKKKRKTIELNFRTKENYLKKIKQLHNNQIASVDDTIDIDHLENLIMFIQQHYNNRIQQSNQVRSSIQQNDFSVYNGMDFIDDNDVSNEQQISPLQYPQPLSNNYSQNQQMLFEDNVMEDNITLPPSMLENNYGSPTTNNLNNDYNSIGMELSDNLNSNNVQATNNFNNNTNYNNLNNNYYSDVVVDNMQQLFYNYDINNNFIDPFINHSKEEDENNSQNNYLFELLNGVVDPNPEDTFLTEEDIKELDLR